MSGPLPYNPCGEAQFPLGAKLWELLRRNAKFQEVAAKFVSDANFRNLLTEYHHEFARVALQWTIRPSYSKSYPGRSHVVNGPDLPRKETKKFVPLACSTAWNDTHPRFRQEFNAALCSALGMDANQLGMDANQPFVLTFDSLVPRGGAEAWRMHYLKFMMVHSDYLCFAVPRGPATELRLEKLCKWISEEIGREHPAMPDYHTTFLGSEKNWTGWLIWENSGSNAEVAARNWADRYGKQATDPHESFGKQIREHRDAIDGWIRAVYPKFTFRPVTPNPSRKRRRKEG